MKLLKKLSAVLTASAMTILAVPVTASSETAPEMFEYSEIGGNITITAYTGTDEYVEIPSHINGKPVTAVGSSAFYCCFNVRSVTVPDGVVSIGNSAFESCGSLEAVELPDSVTDIGGSAFFNCSALTAISIPDSVETIGSMAFYNCSSLKTAVIPASVTELDGTFWYCSGLTSVTIPDGLVKIGCFTFAGCTSLTYMDIPSSVSNIGDYAFYGCSELAAPVVKASIVTAETAFDGCQKEIVIMPDADVPQADPDSVTVIETVHEEGQVMAKTPASENPIAPESQSVYTGEDISSGAGLYAETELLY